VDSARLSTAVRRWWWLIFLLTLQSTVIAFVVSNGLPKQYSAEARVLVGSITDPSTDALTAYQQLAQTYSQLASTTPVLSRVIAALGLRVDPTDLAQQVDVRAPLGDTILRIDTTSGSPDQAAQLANAIAAEITILAKPTGQPSLATVVQPAIPPDAPTSPRIVLNTLIAAFLGLGLGIGASLLLGYRSARVA
jgi:succinoglycan biosynthesis transport protein ExoP